MTTSSASRASLLRNYAIQAAAVVAQIRHELMVAELVSDILHARRGSTAGLPSGAIHSEVSLCLVVTCLNLETGDELQWVPEPGRFTREELGIYCGMLNVRHGYTNLYTISEEEYDHEQA
jgi:hypothetical protein